MTIYITDKLWDHDTLNKILKQPKERIAEGFYGEVFLIEYEGFKFALKMFKDTMKDADVFDYEVLYDLHHLPYFPTLYAYSDETWMLTEYIEGNILRNSDNPAMHSLSMLDLFRTSAKQGWLPHDVKGENIKICDILNIPIVIDVGHFVPIPIERVDLAERAAWVMSHCHRFPSVAQPLP